MPHGCRSGDEPRGRTWPDLPGGAAHPADKIFMSQLPGGGNHRRAGDVVRREVAQQIGPAQAAECLFRPDHRPPQRMIPKLGGIQQILNMFGRLIAIHRDLFPDHTPFPLNLRGREQRPEKHVEQDVQQIRPPGRLSTGIKTGMLLVGERVQVTADSLHRLGNLGRGAPRGPLEQQMLQEMGDAARGIRLMTPARSHPDTHRHAGHVGHLRRRHPQAPRQRGDVGRNVGGFHRYAAGTLSGAPTVRRYWRIFSTAASGVSTTVSRSTSPGEINFAGSMVVRIQSNIPCQYLLP